MNKKIAFASFILSVLTIFLMTGFKNHTFKEMVKTEFEDNMTPKKVNYELIEKYELINFKTKEKITTDKLKNKLFILNFYEPWCPACNKEFYVLDNFAKLYKGKIKVLSVSSGEDMEMLNNWYRKWKYKNIDFYIDKTDKLTRFFKVRSIPATYIIKNQKVLYEFIGDRDYMSLSFRNYMDYLLKQND